MIVGGRPCTHSAGWRRNKPLLVVLAICIAPVLASYLAYYAFPPSGRTNYGELVQPQRPVPALALRNLDGTPFDLQVLRGNWIMVTADRGACTAACESNLWNMRQVRTATGKERDRIARLFLVLDDEAPQTRLLREFEGTRVVRARPQEVAAFLVLPEDAAAKLEDHVWLIDPLGNLMLRWPPAADPGRMKKDLDRLLRASRIG
jgi:hypothetical protein